VRACARRRARMACTPSSWPSLRDAEASRATSDPDREKTRLPHQNMYTRLPAAGFGDVPALRDVALHRDSAAGDEVRAGRRHREELVPTRGASEEADGILAEPLLKSGVHRRLEPFGGDTDRTQGGGHRRRSTRARLCLLRRVRRSRVLGTLQACCELGGRLERRCRRGLRIFARVGRHPLGRGDPRRPATNCGKWRKTSSGLENVLVSTARQASATCSCVAPASPAGWARRMPTICPSATPAAAASASVTVRSLAPGSGSELLRGATATLCHRGR
jgi:hypothetical protein